MLVRYSLISCAPVFRVDAVQELSWALVWNYGVRKSFCSVWHEARWLKKQKLKRSLTHLNLELKITKPDVIRILVYPQETNDINLIKKFLIIVRYFENTVAPSYTGPTSNRIPPIVKRSTLKRFSFIPYFGNKRSQYVTDKNC